MTDFQQRREERIVEIRHRLLVEAGCVEPGRSPDFLNVEEELLDELRELERALAAEETGSHDQHAAPWKKCRETSI